MCCGRVRVEVAVDATVVEVAAVEAAAVEAAAVVAAVAFKAAMAASVEYDCMMPSCFVVEGGTVI